MQLLRNYKMPEIESWMQVQFRKRMTHVYILYQFLGCVTLVVQRPVASKLSRGRSVGRCVGPYVRLSSALWKNCGSDWMPLGIIGRTGPGMRQVTGFGDWSMERGTFGAEFGARHCNQC